MQGMSGLKTGNIVWRFDQSKLQHNGDRLFPDKAILARLCLCDGERTFLPYCFNKVGNFLTYDRHVSL